ncbi:MAG: hypothetical protein JWP42_1638 [Pseudomonas sp.]|nr:hypothetical protein [Pseudomonas sp.]
MLAKNLRTPQDARPAALLLTTIASKLPPTKCVHRSVTIGAIYVCTFSFSALKSYTLPFRLLQSIFRTSAVEK